MADVRHTPGPWAWDGDYYLRPVNAQPDISAVHTILSPEGCYGYLLASHEAVMAEDAANRALIAEAPELLKALQGVLRMADRATVEFDAARAAIARATGTAP